MENNVTNTIFNRLFKDFELKHLLVMLIVILYLAMIGGGFMIYKQLTNHIPTEFSKIEAKFNKLDAKIDKLDQKVDQNYNKLNEKIDQNYNKLNDKIDRNHNELKTLFIQYLGIKKNNKEQ